MSVEVEGRIMVGVEIPVTVAVAVEVWMKGDAKVEDGRLNVVR